MIRALWARWNEFWFGPVGLLNLAVFRITFTATLIVMYMSRQADVKLFYTDEGILPKALSFQILTEGFRPLWQMSFWSDAWVPWVHGLFILSLCFICIGWMTRFFGFLALYIHVAFIFRNYGVAFGADQISAFFLFYMAFTQADARLSLRAYLRERAGLLPLQGGIFTSAFYRWIQIQLCLIYVYSGMEKLRGASWWDGTAVWSVFANSQMVIADFTWTRHVPLLIVAISFGTILFELYFPVLVWFPRVRKWCLLGGVLFHTGIGIVMALFSFAAVMISPYVLFIDEAKLRAWLSRWERPWMKSLIGP